MADAPWWEGPLSYDRVPEQFNIVPLLIDRHLAEGHGERPAIVTPERTISYAALAAGVARAARLLERLGVQREQRVAMLLPDSPEFAYVFFGAMKAGMVPVPLSTLATDDECDYALRDSRAVALVTDACLYDRVEPVWRALPALRSCLVAGDAPPEALPFDAAHAAEPPGYEAAPTHRDDMAYWLYSSGTTGRPKAIVHVNAYQRELEDTYADWSDDLARDLAAAEDDDRREEILAAALAALLLRLRQEGRESMAKWLSSVEPTPEVLQALADAVAENDRLLEQNLLPAIERKMRGGLQDEDILKALALGTGAAALVGLLATIRARVALYAGGLWSFMQHAIGLGAPDRMYWHLDPLAHHCPSCLAFGNKEYESFDAMLRETGGIWPSHGTDCAGNCRCSLEAVTT